METFWVQLVVSNLGVSLGFQKAVTSIHESLLSIVYFRMPDGNCTFTHKNALKTTYNLSASPCQLDKVTVISSC